MMKFLAYLNLVGAGVNIHNMVANGFQLWILAVVIFNITIFFKFYKS